MTRRSFFFTQLLTFLATSREALAVLCVKGAGHGRLRNEKQLELKSDAIKMLQQDFKKTNKTQDKPDAAHVHIQRTKG